MIGDIVNDKWEKLTLKEQLQVHREVLDEIRQDTPHFQFKLIFTSFKGADKQHLQKQIDAILQGNELEDELLREIIAPGVDMVGEEDTFKPINYFAE